jgi:NDP-sugar pyrophosphorylase family protein
MSARVDVSSVSDRGIAAGTKALVLAAGEGSRLRPLTLTMPKPMVPIGGRPLLEHTLNWLRSYGVRDVAINLHYHGKAVTSYFGNGSGLGVRITYSPEETILGTAGAVRKLRDFFDGPALVIYGDLLTNVNLDRLMAFHGNRRRNDPRMGITMSLYEPPNPRECGIVELDQKGAVIRMQEKPKDEKLFSTLAFSGVMVLDPEVIEMIPPGCSYDFGFHLLPRVIEEGLPVYGLRIGDPEYVIDIGTPERYVRACEEWDAKSASRTGETHVNGKIARTN